MADPTAMAVQDALADVLGELSEFAQAVAMKEVRPADAEKLLAETHAMLRRALLRLGDDPDKPETQKRLPGFAGDLSAREHASKGAISRYRPRGGGLPGTSWPADMSEAVSKKVAASKPKGRGR